PDLRIEGHPDVSAVGDVAAVGDGGSGDGDHLLPQLAQVAKQSGAYVGRRLRREHAGKPVRPFRYKDLGSMATIGRNAAVADLRGGVRLTGFPAWVAWLVPHLVQL